jgi:hypothetical protein
MRGLSNYLNYTHNLLGMAMAEDSGHRMIPLIRLMQVSGLDMGVNLRGLEVPMAQ